MCFSFSFPLPLLSFTSSPFVPLFLVVCHLIFCPFLHFLSFPFLSIYSLFPFAVPLASPVSFSSSLLHLTFASLIIYFLFPIPVHLPPPSLPFPFLCLLYPFLHLFPSLFLSSLSPYLIHYQFFSLATIPLFCSSASSSLFFIFFPCPSLVVYENRQIKALGQLWVEAELMNIQTPSLALPRRLSISLSLSR